MGTLKRTIRAVVVGAGNRAMIYASWALEHPDELKIVGVVDPDPIRRKKAADLHGIEEANQFATLEEFLDRPKMADAVMNGTMDHIHVETSLPILEAGYDLLLEKPIAPTQEEVLQLLDTAKRCGRKVMICHVLRYAPFYVEVKKRILNGDIGKIISIQTEENVSYDHMAVSYVRGKWGRSDVSHHGMLMAKSCHDLDIITWLKKDARPKRVSSFGSLMYFRPENAPEGAGKRCLVDCNIEAECPYSAKKLYVDRGLWKQYAWHSIEHISLNPTEEQKIESLKTDNPYGRCVWHCDNDVVDHQVVAIEFEDGATGAHHMTGGTSRPCRTLHIVGTKGEIYGVLEDGYFVIRHPDPNAEKLYTEERIDIDVADDMHGGGDLRLVEDFVRVLQGEEPSISTTALEDSIYGHAVGFAAERSRLEGIVVDIPQI